MTRDRATAVEWLARFEGAGLDGVMAKPYSDDLRVRAIAIVEGGASRHEVAALLEVSPFGDQLAPSLE
jgi:hypothetical protein